MSRTGEFFDSIDWRLLHQQKVTLVEHIAQRREALEDLADTDPTLADFEGILHLIDGVQDFFDTWTEEDA